MTSVVQDGPVRKRRVTLDARGFKNAVVNSGVGENEVEVVYPSTNLSDGSRGGLESD